MKLKNNFFINFFVLALLTSLVTSCKISTPYQRPSLDDIKSFSTNSSADSTSFGELSWWKVFNDPILHDLIKTGLERNVNVNNLALSIQQSYLQLDIVNSQLYPSVGYGVQGIQKNNKSLPVNQSSIISAINVSYTFDIWGRIRNQQSAVTENYLALKMSKNTLEATLIAQISTLYFTLRDIDNKIIITEKMITSLNEFEQIIFVNYSTGFISKVDLNQINISIQNAHAQKETLIRARKQIENALSIIMFSEPIEISRGLSLTEQITVNEFPKGVPVSLIQRRPNIVNAEHQLKAQLHTIDATDALQYPNLNISLSIGASLLKPTLLFSELSGSILGPIFNKNSIKNLLSIEKFQLEKLINNYKQEIYLSLQEIENALIAIETYENEINIRQKQVDLADEAHILAWVRYREGLTSILDFLNIQQSLFAQQLQHSESYKLKLHSIVNLYLALGGGWEQ